eukprot:417475_1
MTELETFRSKYCTTNVSYLKNVNGINHLALVCSDIKKTMDFVNKLGFPLNKVLKVKEGHSEYFHFFFDIGNNSCLAYFWFPEAHKAMPGISTIDQSKIHKSIATAHGSMNHVAFGVDCLENLKKIRKELKVKGLKPTKIVMHQPYGVDLTFKKDITLFASTYLFGPDGEWFEFTFQNIDLSPKNLEKNVNMNVQDFLTAKL